MKIFIFVTYLIALAGAVFLFLEYLLPAFTDNSGNLPVATILAIVFLSIFGIYGIIGERILKKLKSHNPDSLEVEASYYIRKKGVWGKFFLFPFIHIKSKYSLVIAFFGSLVWIIILMVIYFGIVSKILNN